MNVTLADNATSAVFVVVAIVERFASSVDCKFVTFVVPDPVVVWPLKILAGADNVLPAPTVMDAEAIEADPVILKV